MSQTTNEARAKRNSRARASRHHANGHEIGRQASVVAHDIHEMGGVMKEVAQKKIGQAREKAAEYSGEGREAVAKVGESFADSIREKPIRSMLIAAGVGLFFGRFWMGR